MRHVQERPDLAIASSFSRTFMRIAFSFLLQASLGNFFRPHHGTRLLVPVARFGLFSACLPLVYTYTRFRVIKFPVDEHRRAVLILFRSNPVFALYCQACSIGPLI